MILTATHLRTPSPAYTKDCFGASRIYAACRYNLTLLLNTTGRQEKCPPLRIQAFGNITQNIIGQFIFALNSIMAHVSGGNSIWRQ